MKRESPAFPRNRDPILAVLRETLPPTGLVLEIAAGSGQHAVAFATAFPGCTWQPTDRDDGALASIAAWATEGPPNLRTPLRLDAAEEEWPVDRVDAIVAINVLHASPWETTPGLMAGAARRLAPGAPLVVYGAWRRHGTAEPSNLAFDEDLRGRDPRFGIRDVDEVIAVATAAGLRWERLVEMPANNRTLVFRAGAVAG
jgi:hypothetical protein